MTQDDDGFILYESRAICRYIANKYANQGPALIPTVVKEVALFEQAASVEQNNFDPYASKAVAETIFKPYVYIATASCCANHSDKTDRYMGLKPDQAVFDDLIKSLSARLDVYEVILSKQKYIAGNVRLLFLSLYNSDWGL